MRPKIVGADRKCRAFLKKSPSCYVTLPDLAASLGYRVGFTREVMRQFITEEAVDTVLVRRLGQRAVTAYQWIGD